MLKCKACGSSNVIETDSKGNPIESRSDYPSRFCKCNVCGALTHRKLRHKKFSESRNYSRKTVRLVNC
jgi:hypothetical protein